jgi:hypothetical protein
LRPQKKHSFYHFCLNFFYIIYSITKCNRIKMLNKHTFMLSRRFFFVHYDNNLNISLYGIIFIRCHITHNFEWDSEMWRKKIVYIWDNIYFHYIRKEMESTSYKKKLSFDNLSDSTFICLAFFFYFCYWDVMKAE